MPQDPSALEQAVSRAVRDNLVTLQRSAEELQQAFADVVASCASSRPTYTLAPLLRAQTAAASLAASLEVLTRFIAGSAQAPAMALPESVTQVVSVPAPEPPAAPVAPPPRMPTPMAEEPAPAAATSAAAPPVPERVGTGTAWGERRPEIGVETVRSFRPEPVPEVTAEAAASPTAVEEAPVFDLNALDETSKEMHRRANRHIKVSMQDIKLLRKDAVKQGREQKDLCIRLKDDLDKARKEYERRFKPILGHPVDYFYKWAVEILADGDPDALGEYPYPSPVAKR